MIHMNWCHQFGGSKYGAYMNESTRSQDNCNAAPTFARIFSAPMAIPACASPPIKGWLPALGKFIIRKRFLSSSAEYNTSYVLFFGLAYLRSIIISCMHGAGVILVPSRVRTFEIKTIQLNAVWVYGGKFMIMGRENLRVTDFESLSQVCATIIWIFLFPLLLFCKHYVPLHPHQALLFSVDSECKIWAVG